MVALSRLKATFEACLGLFRQNMKTLGRESRRGGMQKPRRRVRRTEPLPTMYSPQYTRRPKQLRTVLRRMHRRGPPLSACPTHAGNLVLKPRRKQVFSGSDGGLVMQRNMDMCGVCAWCHKFTVDPVYTVQAFKAAARLMCPATAPLLNPTPASIHLPQFTAMGIPLS